MRLIWVINFVILLVDAVTYKSILGDPGMTSDHFRIGLEAWNFCNGAQGGPLSENNPSPRYADCVDNLDTGTNLVSKQDNALTPPNPIPGFPSTTSENQYAIEKEQYLGELCKVSFPSNPSNYWYFWMAMLKSGNFDLSYGYCPKTSIPLASPLSPNFICFNSTVGCMNQPIVYHEPSKPSGNGSLTGRFYGTYDILTTTSDSFFEVRWNRVESRWIFSYTLKTSQNYPYLMLYHRSDNANGLNGGYAWPGRGMMLYPPYGDDFIVQLRLNVTYFNPVKTLQFYMPEMAGCWKYNGMPCDGDVSTDITRYFEMVVNPQAGPCGDANSYLGCPPTHTSISGEVIYRNDTARYPYQAYHQWCAPPSAPKDVVGPRCDPYSNPQQQELVMCRPHPEWATHGFPSTPGEGWIGDSKLWKLNVGQLTSRLYFSGTKPQERIFNSFNIGPELFSISTIQWEVSDFDVLMPTN